MITRRVDLAMSVFPYERQDVGNLLAQRKFVSSVCHVHPNALKTPSFDAKIIFLGYIIILVNTYRLPQKKVATLTLTPITLKSVYLPHNHILRSRVGGALQSRFATFISPFPFGPFSWVSGIWQSRYSTTAFFLVSFAISL